MVQVLAFRRHFRHMADFFRPVITNENDIPRQSLHSVYCRPRFRPSRSTVNFQLVPLLVFSSHMFSAFKCTALHKPPDVGHLSVNSIN